MIVAINPATDEKINTYQEHSEHDLELLIEKNRRATSVWAMMNFKERGEKVQLLALGLKKNKERFAQLITREMGKPITQSRLEIDKCVWLCEFFAGHCEKFLKDEMIETDAEKSYITFEPLGSLLAIMPWNFPFWQLFRAAIPAMMAGNGVILKHAANVPGCAYEIEQLFHQAQFPEGCFANVFIQNSQVEKIIAHDAVQGVTLTGSPRAGSAVAGLAGKHLKKTVMELGGSDPYLILEDADLEKSAFTCAASRLINAGQSCVAAKRFIVLEKSADEFEQKLVAEMNRQVMGNPFDENVTLGPLARKDLREELHGQVSRSLELGARLLCGGQIPSGPGAFYFPTVLSNVRRGMPVYHEETFGPVAAVIRVKDEKEAAEVANETVFGLGAALFSKNPKRAEKIARQSLRAGMCFINAYVKSDPRMPFGGIKKSGYGRELGYYGIKEFVNIKTVSVYP